MRTAYPPRNLAANVKVKALTTASLLVIVALGVLVPFAPAQTTVGNGLLSTESTTTTTGCNGGTCGAATDTLWADGNYYRWRMNLHGAGPVLVASWPCASAGCIPYAGTGVTAAAGITVYPETPLTVGTANSFLQVNGSGLPNWVPNPVFGVAGTSAGQFSLAGATSGTTVVKTAALAGGTATVPNNTGTVAELNLAQSWTATQTLSGAQLNLAAATASYPSVNIPSGTAPSANNFGDVWGDGTTVYLNDSVRSSPLPRVARITSDTGTSTSTSFGDLTGVSFNVATNANYSIDCELIYTATGGSPNAGLQVLLTGPTVTAGSMNLALTAGKGAGSSVYSSVAAFSSALTTGAVSAAGTWPFRVVGGFTTSASGTVQVRWANTTGSGATTKIMAGSYCVIY